MKRQHIVAGNWKMNKSFEEGRDLALTIREKLVPSEVLAVLCPPFIHLNYISALIKEINNLHLGAQNCHFETSGAFTGEISAPMLRSVGAGFVIIGHSERREYFQEDDAMLAKKTDAVLAAGMRPIFCCGEKLEVREAGAHEELVKTQLENGLFHLSAEQFSKVVIAYEPVWAIGTGKTASAEQAQEMHHHIRTILSTHFDTSVSNQIPILYGGSCNPTNAKELFSQPDVDGGLIGGASLKVADFIAIINSF